MGDGGGAPEIWAFGGDGGDGVGMSATVPTDPAAIIEFATPHAPVWVAHAVQIGSTPAEAAAVADALAAATAAQHAAFAARNAAEAATAAYYNATAVLREAAARVVRNAHSFARATDDPGVYARAEIPAPRTRRRSLPPPNTPTRLEATLMVGGALKLSWRASHPRGMSGVVYEVSRKLPGHSTPTVLSTTGERTFIDRTLPAGAVGGGAGVEYSVTALRGSQRSEGSMILTVTVGVGVGVGSGAGEREIRQAA